MVERMPEARLKSLIPSNSSTVNPNDTWSVSLESYYPYLQPQKVSENPQTYCVHNTLLKSAKSHFGCVCPLGVKSGSAKKKFLVISIAWVLQVCRNT
jgi:hypothetical protein